MDSATLEAILADYTSVRKKEQVPQATRRRKLRAFADALGAARERIYEALSADLNRDAMDTLLSELLPLLQIIRFMARKMARILRPSRLPWSMATFPASAKLVREPFGRVLVVSTWNYPLLLALEPALGAYAAGNRVVLKLSPRAPHCNAVMKELLGKVFASDEILIIGDELPLEKVTDKRYDYIFFTGSSRSGKEVLKRAAEFCTPATVELGGKNPCIVAQDADLRVAAKRIVWGKFFNAGQSCAAPDHLLVHRDVKDELVNFIRREIKKLYGEHPLDDGKFPAMPDRDAYERVCRIAAGGRLLHGGDRDPERLCFEPTVIDRIEVDSPLLAEEVFAPLLPVVEFANETELFQKLLTLEHPLALYCFGGTGKFRKQLISAVPCGALVFNDVLIHFSNMHIPFGGVGASGFGAYHGTRTLTTFTHEKPVVKQFASLDFPFRYPPHRKFLRKIVEFFCNVR